jgi:non-specific protein-tyrosine kinase
VRSRDVLEAITPGVPSLARIPSFKWTPEAIALSRPLAPESEAFRRLRAALEAASIDQQGAVVLVTSASTKDGKTTVAANLAVVLAQSGRSVALVDADLRQPRIHHMFESVDGLDGGLTSAVIGRTELADGAHERDVGNGRLWIIPSGPLPPSPAELLGSKQANRIFELLRDSVDIVIVDSPPVLPVADALVLSRMADSTLLVANAERTRRDELAGAFVALDQAGARVAGTVLNQALAGGNDTYYKYGRGDTIKPQRFGVGRRRRGRDPSAAPWQSLLNPDDLPRFEAATKAHSNPNGVSTETDSE